MKYCIPDELFNRIPYPELESEQQNASLDGMLREIYYKLPNAEPVEVKKEAWHALCDFCSRLGALLERTSAGGRQAYVVPSDKRKFLRIVGAKADGKPTMNFNIQFVKSGNSNTTRMMVEFPEGTNSAEVVYSVRPAFDYEPDANNAAGQEWAPKIPQYMIDRYGECIAHGALMRLYAMRGDAGMARMHATAYNNDLNRLSFGLITSGMRKHLLIDTEDWLVNTNGNG